MRHSVYVQLHIKWDAKECGDWLTWQDDFNAYVFSTIVHCKANLCKSNFELQKCILGILYLDHPLRRHDLVSCAVTVVSSQSKLFHWYSTKGLPVQTFMMMLN